MSKSYTEVQNEIISKLIYKSTDEIVEFLDLNIDTEENADDIIRRFKYNIQREMRHY